MYNNLDLKQYCIENGVNYKYVKYKLKCYKNNREKLLPFEIQVQLAIQKYKKLNKYVDIKYKEFKLIDYCKTFNIEYKRIASRCRYFVKKYNDFSLLTENQISIFIENYYKKEEIKKLKQIFFKLDNCSEIEYRSICKELNINYKEIKKKTLNNNLNMKSLIYIIWYSGDKKNSNGIYISQKKLDKILKQENLELNDLYGMYKSGNKVYLDKIFEHQKFYLMGFVLRTIREYNFRVYASDYEDLFSEAKIILFNCISRNVYGQVGRIIRYIEKSVTKQILAYLIKNYSNKFLVYDDNLRERKNLKQELEF